MDSVAVTEIVSAPPGGAADRAPEMMRGASSDRRAIPIDSAEHQVLDRLDRSAGNGLVPGAFNSAV